MKMSNLLGTIVISGMLLWGSASVQAMAEREFLSDYMQVHYDLTNGFVSDEANAVLQTRDGYIWTASYAGLTRYDGKKFQLMKNSDGTPVTRVRALFEDSRGLLWIGANNMGLMVYDNGLIRREERETSSSIRDIKENKEGIVYVASSEGVKCFYPDGTMEVLADERINHHMVVSLDEDIDGALWGVTSAGDVFSLQGTQVEAFYPKESFAGTTCVSIYADGAGHIYIGTSDAAVLVKKGDLFERLRTGTDSNVTSMYKDKEGKLWVCTDKGLGYFDSAMEYKAVEGALMGLSLENIWEDYEHNYWISSSRQGLLHIIHSRFRNISFEGAVPQDVFNAVQIYEGNIYMGAENGLYILDSQHNQVHNELTEALKGIRIRDFLADSQGTLWIATTGKLGLISYKDGQWHSWSQQEGLASNKVRVLLERTNGDIAVGTGNGLNIFHQGQLVRAYGRKEGMQNSVILYMLEDKEGNLLAGTDGQGIYRIHQDGSLDNINDADNGDKLGTILRMYRDDETGDIWISNGISLYRMDTAGSVHGIDPGNVDCSNIYDLLITDGRMWLMRQNGVYLVPLKDLRGDAIHSYEYVKYADTLHSSFTANSENILMPDGTFLFATSHGVLGIDTRHVDTEKMTPKVAIDQVIINEGRENQKVWSGGSTIVLPSDTARVTIRFAILSFTDADTSMEYQMEGFDKEPVRLHNEHVYEATYTNLKGGTYQFHVKGWLNEENDVSGQTMVTIEKEYAFFEYLPVRIAGLLLLAALSILAGHYYMKGKMKNKVARAELRQKEYQAITTEAIMAIANTIDAKDKYTNGHSKRVAWISRAIARKLGWSEDKVEKVYYTALLHDIGKIGIPDKILNKPGKLTDEEYAIIKEHTNIGFRILHNMEVIPYIKDGAHYHHERYDGRGYPTGMKGEEIPIVARVIGVADAFDAMYSSRIYRPAFTLDYIIEELKKCSGTQFDPVMAKALLELIDEGFLNTEND